MSVGTWRPETAQVVNAEEEIIRGVAESLPPDADDWDIEAALVAECRRRDPMSRGDGLWRYSRNGGTVAERECRLCGTSVSWCNKWRRTKASVKAEKDDIDGHIAEVRAMMERA